METEKPVRLLTDADPEGTPGVRVIGKRRIQDTEGCLILSEPMRPVSARADLADDPERTVVFGRRVLTGEPPSFVDSDTVRGCVSTHNGERRITIDILKGNLSVHFNIGTKISFEEAFELLKFSEEESTREPK